MRKKTRREKIRKNRDEFDISFYVRFSYSYDHKRCFLEKKLKEKKRFKQRKLLWNRERA